MYVNNNILIGNLVRDPVSNTVNGVSVCNFTLAINRSYKNAEGKYDADFIPVVVWRGLADNCAKYLKKGDNVGVIGSLQSRTYEDSNKQKHYVLEVKADQVKFGFKKSDGQTASPERPSKPQENYTDDTGNVSDEEMPF